MVPIDTGSMPIWVQILITLAPVIAAAIAVARGYKFGVTSTVSHTVPTQNDQAIMQILGGSFAEKHSSLAMIEALRDIKEAIIGSAEEIRKVRKAIEDHTESTVKRSRTSNRKLP